jgi:hypothetical protein
MLAFKPWPYKLPLGVRAMYEIWLGDEKIGVVSHQKVEVRRTYSRWNKQGGYASKVTRRVRPLAWRARGYLAQGPYDFYTRQDAAEALAEAHLAAKQKKGLA